ncbi:MAG: hypothetical protein IK066_04195 [Kiritimatiellae bacterium]|nr:hypothetical protein [Kiritimatiellia bacterium]
MSLSLSAIRNLHNNESIVFDRANDTLKNAGFWQNLKSIFNICGAQDKNRQTINEIKSALRNDWNIQSEDLLEIADGMLDKVRTDRAIGAAQINGILDEIERLSDNAQPVIRERAMMHMAARPFPPELDAAREEIVGFIADHISIDSRVRAIPLSADVKQMATNTLTQIRNLGRVLQGSRSTPDPGLLSVCVKHLVPLLWQDGPNGDRVLRPAPERLSRMDALSRFLGAAETRAQQLGQPRLLDLALKFIDKILDLPDPGAFDHLEALIRDVPLQDLVRIDAGLSAADVFNRYLASLQPPAPDPAVGGSVAGVQPSESGPAAGELPRIHNKEELAAFIRSLDATSQFGTVSESLKWKDADGVQRQTYDYRGIVFRGVRRSISKGLRFDTGFQSEKPLKEPKYLREAMGLGTGTRGNIANRGVTGDSGVSTAKNPAGALIYRGARDLLYVIDTTKIPQSRKPWEGKCWDMDETFVKNGFGKREDSGDVATGGEVNCSEIPPAAIIGALVISAETDNAADPAEKVRHLKGCELHFNPGYQP